MPKKYIGHEGLASPFFNKVCIRAPKTFGIAYLSFSRYVTVNYPAIFNEAYNQTPGKLRLSKNIF